MIAHSRETRVGACADYLLGVPLKEIARRWGVNQVMPAYWVRKVGCFKLRVESLADRPRPNRTSS